jgi:hypothetical protein
VEKLIVEVSEDCVSPSYVTDHAALAGNPDCVKVVMHVDEDSVKVMVVTEL